MSNAELKQYWIGDPCYVLNEANGFDWGQIVYDTDLFNLIRPKDEQGGVFDIGGHKVAVSSTAHGDGLYADESGKLYGVDAGCLSCVPVELLPDGFDGEDLGHVWDAPCQAANNVTYQDGVVRFLDSMVKIDTEYDCE